MSCWRHHPSTPSRPCHGVNHQRLPLQRKLIDESWSFADCHGSQCQRHMEQHWNILKFNQNHAVHLQFYKYYPNLVPQFLKRMPFVCKASVYLPNQALALQHLQHLRQHHSLRAVRTLLPECYVAPLTTNGGKVLRPKGFTYKSGPRHPTWSPQKMVVLGMTVWWETNSTFSPSQIWCLNV